MLTKLDTCLCTFQLLVEALSFCKIRDKCQQAMISDLPSYDVFVPQKLPLLKIFMTLLHVICGLGLPKSKILGTPVNRRSPENFLKTFFFVGEHLRLCPWFLTLASSISVLGLERFCPRKGCTWPRIVFVSLALASSLVSSTPPLAITHTLSPQGVIL